MNRDALLAAGKIVAVIGLLLSGSVLLHYEFNVKQFYSNNPQTLGKDMEKVASYVNRTGCVSKREVWKNTGFGYFESWYLLHKLTKNRTLLHFKGKGICFNHLKQAQIKSPQMK